MWPDWWLRVPFSWEVRPLRPPGTRWWWWPVAFPCADFQAEVYIAFFLKSGGLFPFITRKSYSLKWVLSFLKSLH